MRPDHDRLTYRAISEADLLVFVVTNEQFDAHIAKHFRKLAVERGKAHEMMLAVNKMRIPVNLSSDSGGTLPLPTRQASSRCWLEVVSLVLPRGVGQGIFG